MSQRDDLSLLPPPLDVPADQRGEATLPMRYEDVTQDGRLACRAMTHALGPTVWEKVLLAHPMTKLLGRDGIVPILSRLSIVSFGSPIAFGPRPRTRGCFALCRATDARGRTRFRLDMGVTVHGVVGHTYAPAAPGTGTPIDVGRVEAEHVLTRPFGPPDARRVDALPEGVHPDREGVWREPESALELPTGAQWIDADFATDANVLVLGLGHTDSNQHVNSLVYPLAVEEAALRHAARPRTARFCHHFELAFRKPFFEGDRMQVVLRAYARADAFGVVARCVDGGGVARTFGRLELVP